jgi:8-oxo-dGTP pyrophosphatase MutT (NUDIX family)
MDKQTFLNRFLLHNPQSQLNRESFTRPFNQDLTILKKAAVLLPIVKRPHGLNLILTERALHLRHHPGQVSFPGGKYERMDPNLQYTALRETEEEIGILQNQVAIFGSLPSLPTVSGFVISPFLGFVDSNHSTLIDYQEVRTVFEVPLEFLLNYHNFHQQHVIVNQKHYFTYCIPYKNKFIWGVTAQILKNLQRHLSLSLDDSLQESIVL